MIQACTMEGELNEQDDPFEQESSRTIRPKVAPYAHHSKSTN